MPILENDSARFGPTDLMYWTEDSRIFSLSDFIARKIEACQSKLNFDLTNMQDFN